MNTWNIATNFAGTGRAARDLGVIPTVNGRIRLARPGDAFVIHGTERAGRLAGKIVCEGRIEGVVPASELDSSWTTIVRQAEVLKYLSNSSLWHQTAVPYRPVPMDRERWVAWFEARRRNSRWMTVLVTDVSVERQGEPFSGR